MPAGIVAASPDPSIMSKGGLGGRKIIVASEYENLTRRWIAAKGVEVSALHARHLGFDGQIAAHVPLSHTALLSFLSHARRPSLVGFFPLQYTFLRAYGATESLPPEDADVIVDNAATGATLKANSLEVFDTLINSTTRLYASKEAWASALSCSISTAQQGICHRWLLLSRALASSRLRALRALSHRPSCFMLLVAHRLLLACRPRQARPHRAARPAAALRPRRAQAADADLQLPRRQAGEHARLPACVSWHALLCYACFAAKSSTRCVAGWPRDVVRFMRWDCLHLITSFSPPYHCILQAQGPHRLSPARRRWLCYSDRC